jgi:hypothetical protein
MLVTSPGLFCCLACFSECIFPPEFDRYPCPQRHPYNLTVAVEIKKTINPMDFQTYSKKVALIELYIKNKWANTPDSIAQKLGISKRTVLRMVDYLKKDGKPISYCKKEKIYKI